jgi:hypothetical protein
MSTSACAWASDSRSGLQCVVNLQFVNTACRLHFAVLTAATLFVSEVMDFEEEALLLLLLPSTRNQIQTIKVLTYFIFLLVALFGEIH